MTPIYLNPPTSSIPLLEYKEDYSFQLLSQTNRHSPSPTSFLNFHAQEQYAHSTIEPIQALAKDEKFVMFHDQEQGNRHRMSSMSMQGEQSTKVIYNHESNSSQNSSTHHMHMGIQEEAVQPIIGESSSSSTKQEYFPAIYDSTTSSGLMERADSPTVTIKPKVRMVHRFQVNRDQQRSNGNCSKNNSSSTNNVRECSDCHTTTTPLWRSGPQGPKSLCNACGIRQRKARRAMEAAAAAAASTATATATPNKRIHFGTARSVSSSDQQSSYRVKDQQKETGSLENSSSHLLPYKKRGKLLDNNNNPVAAANYKVDLYKTNYKAEASFFDDDSSASSCLSKDSDFKPRSAFPRDEEEGAVLLMGLSCGLTCS